MLMLHNLDPPDATHQYFRNPRMPWRIISTVAFQWQSSIWTLHGHHPGPCMDLNLDSAWASTSTIHASQPGPCMALVLGPSWTQHLARTLHGHKLDPTWTPISVLHGIQSGFRMASNMAPGMDLNLGSKMVPPYTTQKGPCSLST